MVHNDTGFLSYFLKGSVTKGRACGSNSIKEGGAGDEVFRAWESKLKEACIAGTVYKVWRGNFSSKASGDTNGNRMSDQVVGTGWVREIVERKWVGFRSHFYMIKKKTLPAGFSTTISQATHGQESRVWEWEETFSAHLASHWKLLFSLKKKLLLKRIEGN